MTLEKIRSEGHGVTKNRLVTCPLCGHEFEKNEPRWAHFLNDHEPEDAGLPPAGEIRESGEPLVQPPTERFVPASTLYDATSRELTSFGREFLGLEGREPPEPDDRGLIPDGGREPKEILVCPECQESTIETRSRSEKGKWYCFSCYAHFDQPDTRESKHHSGRRGLAGILEDPELTELPGGSA